MAQYRRKSFFACNALTLLHRNESHETVYNERGNYPAAMRPVFPNIDSAFWTFFCSSMKPGRQVSVGLSFPVVDLLRKVPFPAAVGSLAPPPPPPPLTWNLRAVSHFAKLLSTRGQS